MNRTDTIRNNLVKIPIFEVKKEAKDQKTNIFSSVSEEVRLELLNLAVLFRSQMIGKEEFQSKAHSMGVLDTPENILAEFRQVNP